MTEDVIGRCHCGAVSITVPTPPREVPQCNCSLCMATGFLGSYYDPADVRITGGEACDAYIWGDRMIANWHCRTCGVGTHWTPLPGTRPDRMAVNIRMFAPEIWETLPVRSVDGRSY